MDKWHQNSVSEDLWKKISHAFETGVVTKGFVKDSAKGGFIIDFMGIDAFLPGSQVELKRVNDFDSYIGSWLDLKIVQINPQYNVVVSHRATLSEALELQKSQIINQLKGISKNAFFLLT